MVGFADSSFSFFSYCSIEMNSGESPGIILHSPNPMIFGLVAFHISMNQECFSFKMPRLVPLGRLNKNVFLVNLSFIIEAK